VSARDAGIDRVMVRTGATYRQLDHWCRRGYLMSGTPGTGYPRDWPESEIQVATVMVKLAAAGIPPKVAERVARAGGNLEIGPGVWVSMSGASGTTPRTRPVVGTTSELERKAA
jgi:hypothetical protein